MKRVIKLKNIEITYLKCIKIDLKRKGKSSICPNWMTNRKGGDWSDNFDTSCKICEQMFPRVKDIISTDYPCPCYRYSPKYLIKRLNEIIRYNKEKE